MMDFAFKMMDFVFKMMDVVSKMIDFVYKMMDFLSKMIDFASNNNRFMQVLTHQNYRLINRNHARCALRAPVINL